MQAAREAEQAKDYPRLAETYQKIAKLRPRDAMAQQSLGLAHYLQSNYTAAVPPLEKALALNPRLYGASLYLGISYYRTNQFSRAVDALKKARQLNPKDHVALYWLGASYLALEAFPEAIADLKSANLAVPEDAEILYLLGKSYAKYSARLLDRLSNLAPASAPAHRLRADDFLAQGATPAALEELDKALQIGPELPALHLAKGEIYWDQKRFDEAAEEFRQELTNDPPGLEAHYRLGAFYLANNRPLEALPHLSFAAKQKPQDQAIQQLLQDASAITSNSNNGDSSFADPKRDGLILKSSDGTLGTKISEAFGYYSRGDFSQAIGVLQPFLVNHPDHVQARQLLVRCFLSQAQVDKAVIELQRILKQLPDEPESLYSLGRAYEALSSEIAQKMYELDPNSYRVHLLRGETYETGSGRLYNKALEEYGKALGLKPDLPGANFAVGRILWKMQRFEEAVPYLYKELERNPYHGLANYHLGNIYLSQGKSEQAIGYLEAAIRAQPNLTEAYLDLGRALAGAGKYDAAIGFYQKVVQNRPDEAGVYALLATAYRALGKEQEAQQSLETFRQLSEKQRQLSQ
jgi:tetratricopeptide (TPR) repeat protein